ncbi:MAG: hypothetical protein WEG56_06525 [Chloroflexota bacterium]
MTGRAARQRIDPGAALPAFDRIAPPPPVAQLIARIDAHTGPGDVVADLAGRGGWVARAALDRQRRAVSIESSPLTRVLAEVVLRPPDVRHLDAAFQGMAASPRGDSSLKVSISDMFATRCATCGRTLVVDEVVWETGGGGSAGARPIPVERHYRCTVCRDQRGGPEARQAPLDPDDEARALADVGAVAARTWLGDRLPLVDGAPTLTDELVDLHTDRQLVALVAIMERIEGDLRAAPVLATLRLAFLHTILAASRLAGASGRTPALRIAGGHVRLPAAERFPERNPWLAFEEAFRLVRGFIQRLEGGPMGPLQARLGEDLRALGEGAATAVLAVASPSASRALGPGMTGDGRPMTGPRIRLVLGQPPVRPSLDRLAAAYHGTAWVLGREAAALLPLGALAETSLRVPWSWQSVAIGRALTDVEPSLARDGRVVQLVDGGPEAVAAVAIGGASAGYRLVLARLANPDGDGMGTVELIPPGAAVPPGPRNRANVALPPVPGGPGDPDLVPGPGLFAPPERYDRRPFSATEAARIVTESAVETLRARGEPARFERLFGEILVGLDRSGQLRRLAAGWRQATEEPADSDATLDSPPQAPQAAPDAVVRGRTAGDDARHVGPIATSIDASSSGPAADPVERLLTLIRDELGRPTQHRLTEIEPGRWWLGDREDRDAAAPPLADRVEWGVFSLLSTAGPLSESAFYERIATMFTGHDLPDEALVRACLDSYRHPTSTPDRLSTADDLLRRSHEHAALVGDIADAGHRLGMHVWISKREQGRRDPRTGGMLGDLLDERERHGYLGGISKSVDDLAEVDALWYVRGKVAFAFEVEWTAILGETLLRRHARIGPDDKLIRFLAIAPERADLLRHKLDRSPLLRQAMEAGDWHVIKWPHLQSFLAAERPDLDALEPLIGLDPVVERSGEQMPLFDG